VEKNSAFKLVEVEQLKKFEVDGVAKHGPCWIGHGGTDKGRKHGKAPGLRRVGARLPTNCYKGLVLPAQSQSCFPPEFFSIQPCPLSRHFNLPI
jgi:hypothetical protein